MAEALAAETGAGVVPVDDAMTQERELLSPNALGGVPTARSIPRLRCRIVCGASNYLGVDPDDATC